jgi:asparagine synthase (glutamine-hydrolysing)
MSFVGLWPGPPRQPRIVERALGAELRIITGADVRLVVVGQCLASDSALADGLREADDFRSAGGWPGCYSLIVLRAHRVVLRVDPVGQFPLFLANSAAGVLFGSRASALARHAGAGLDEVSLLTKLVCPEVLDLAGTRSMFEGVERVAEGHVAHISADGVRIRPDAPLRPDYAQSLGAAAADLRLSLLRAVEARATIAKLLTSDFSGGVDSTSLSFLAARELPKVPVFTYTNRSRPVADDVDRAHGFAKLSPRLAQYVVPGSATDLPYQEFTPSDDEPHPAAHATGSLHARLRMAADLGSDMHLVGEGGDLVLAPPAAYLADLARHGDVSTLWRHCVAWARIRGRSPLSLLRRATLLAGTSRRRALANLATLIEQAGPGGDVPWESDTIGYWRAPHTHWLTAKARAALAGYVRSVEPPDRGELGVGDLVTLGWLRLQTLSQRAVRDAGATLGIAVHAPFLDTDVVRACLTLTAHRRAGVTVPKPLLRAALDGLVPAQVLARPTKGDYTSEAYEGVRRAAPALKQLLATSAAADHGLIEPARVREVLDRAVQGMSTPWGALNQVFAVELWLRDQPGKAAVG